MSRIVASMIWQRNPIIIPKPTDFELEYTKYRNELEKSISKGQYAIRRDKTHPERDTVTIEPHKPSDTTNQRSLDRLPDRRLFMLVQREGGDWIFPFKAHTSNDTLLQTAVEALNEFKGKEDIYCLGNSPLAVHTEGESTMFFFKSQMLPGKVTFLQNCFWLCREEVLEKISPELGLVVDPLLEQ